MTENGEPCEKCGSTNTSGSLEGTIIGRESQPGIRFLKCYDCGHKKKWESIMSDSVGLCSWCGGSGQLEKTNHQGEYPQKYDCPVCNGTGKEPIKSDKGGSK